MIIKLQGELKSIQYRTKNLVNNKINGYPRTYLSEVESEESEGEIDRNKKLMFDRLAARFDRNKVTITIEEPSKKKVNFMIKQDDSQEE